MKTKGTPDADKESPVLMLLATIPESTEAEPAAANDTEEKNELVYRARPHPLSIRKLLKYGDRRRPRRLPNERRRNERCKKVRVKSGHFLVM